MIRHARMRGHRDALPARPRPRVDRRPVRARRILAGEGESRQTLGRERYLERMPAFVDDDPAVMLGQQRRVGASADWGRLRFTMDEGSARAVRVAFERLYRAASPTGPRRSSTGARAAGPAVSDLEVVPTPETGTLWSVRYHLIDPADRRAGSGATITVATTRPETILGDTAVAVHPDDERYRSLVGRRVRIPFVERDVPIIADERRRPRLRDGRRQDHAGPRPRRPRDGAAPWPARPDDPGRRRDGHEHRDQPTVIAVGHGLVLKMQ